MAISIFPRAHTRKPALAFTLKSGHPVLNGLLTGFVMNLGGFWRTRDLQQQFYFDHASAFNFAYERWRWRAGNDGPYYDSWSPSTGTLTELYNNPAAFNVVDFSVSALIRLASGSTAGIQRVFSHQQGSGSPYWGLVINNGRVTALSSADGIVYPGGYGNDLRDDKWHRVDIVRDTARGKFNYYVDGRLVQATTISSTSNMAASTTPLLWGYDIFSERFGGQISDLYLWKRARRPHEVMEFWQRPYDHFADLRQSWRSGADGGGGSGGLARTQVVICG